MLTPKHAMKFGMSVIQTRQKWFIKSTQIYSLCCQILWHCRAWTVSLSTPIST